MVSHGNHIAPNGPSVSLQNVSISRGGQALLRNFNLTIPAKTHQVIVGRSGAGKSTLLGVICGILKADQGAVCVFGTDLSAQNAAGRDRCRAQHMGVVFQNLGLVSALTIGKNLQLAQRMAGLPFDQGYGDELLDRLGLADRKHAKPRHLSRGEAQRAAIARALVVRPKLLIADEPTASLDTAWRDKALALMLAEAKAVGASILVSTHDLEVAERFKHRLTLPQKDLA